MIDENQTGTNGTTGEIHIVLGTTDVGDSPTGVTHDLKLWLGDSIGEDDEPTAWFVAEDSRDRHNRTTDGSSHQMWPISTARLRSICDMIDAMHKVGRDQFLVGGVDVE
jgi:hypothetical protein